MGKISSLLLGAVSGAAAAYFLTSKKGKEITEKVQDFVVDYREDPDKTHEAVVQSVKDFSDQAVKAINQSRNSIGVCQGYDQVSSRLFTGQIPRNQRKV